VICSLTGVIDTSSIAREDYTTHGLHLSYQGKNSFMQLIAERVFSHNVSGISSIPVITHASASLSFTLNSKASRCLTYIKCNPEV
jgi:hypothetical protein